MEPWIMQMCRTASRRQFLVWAALLAAGFVLDADSDALYNKDDPHTAKVFDPEIRGHTDQFILRFKKPQS